MSGLVPSPSSDGPEVVDGGADAAHVAPGADLVRHVAAVLAGGGVVALPTDTVYGLAARPDVPGATARLFALKGRSADVPVAVLCASADQALGLAAPEAVTDGVARMADRLWPGPLTLVLPRRPGLDLALGVPEHTVGVRCPAHALLQALADAVGPVATTSANRHREPTPETAAGVVEALGPGLDLALDGGPCTGTASTVVDATGDDWRLLRAGPIDAAAIEAATAG